MFVELRLAQRRTLGGGIYTHYAKSWLQLPGIGKGFTSCHGVTRFLRTKILVNKFWSLDDLPEIGFSNGEFGHI